ncbi:MAG: DUF2491 family protein [Burkholderiales bacterium]|nr:DUF2491 family protein [Burkholderiales bacterium]
MLGKAEPAPQDAGLPLGARIGSLVHLQMTPLIRAQSAGSLIAMPGEAELRVLAISRVQLQMSGSLYRYYLNCDEDGTEKFLQLYCDANGEVSELLYCSRLTRLIPETSEDQQAYLGEDGYGLGDRSYTLWRAQLAELGMSATALDSAFAAASLEYFRDAGDAACEFVAPFRGSETRIDDAGGRHGLQQDIVFMPYSRQLGDEAGNSMQRELLLISTEIVRSRDGDRSRREIHVDFMIAIPLEMERLTLQ